MKKSGIHAFLISSLVVLSIFSCKKSETPSPFMNDGIITGPDVRACVCCGGLMINFNGDALPYSGEFRLIENGKDLGITDKDKFPIYVNVDWKTDMTNTCNHIIITRMARK